MCAKWQYEIGLEVFVKDVFQGIKRKSITGSLLSRKHWTRQIPVVTKPSTSPVDNVVRQDRRSDDFAVEGLNKHSSLVRCTSGVRGWVSASCSLDLPTIHARISPSGRCLDYLMWSDESTKTLCYTKRRQKLHRTTKTHKYISLDLIRRIGHRHNQ